MVNKVCNLTKKQKQVKAKLPAENAGNKVNWIYWVFWYMKLLAIF